MQTPAQAAPNMMCMHSTITNAWYIDATCTIDTHSAVHCTTHYIDTIQQWSYSHCIDNNTYHALLCYRSIAIYVMHNCPVSSVGGWSLTSSGCLTSKQQCPTTLHQHPRSWVTWILPYNHIHVTHMYTYMHIYTCALRPTSKRPCSEVGVS